MKIFNPFRRKSKAQIQAENDAEFRRREQESEYYRAKYQYEDKVRREFFTPELIKWISDTNDAELLSVTSCLLNCHYWPSWLPSKPDGYDKPENTTGIRLTLACELIDMTKNKANAIVPGLHHIIWITGHHHRFDGYESYLRLKYPESLTATPS